MSFERPWVLLFLLLPAAWLWYERGRTGRPLGLLLKVLGLAAVIAALAVPRVDTSETKMAVAVLVDTSASVSKAGLDKASQVAGAIERARGRGWVSVIPFAAATRQHTGGTLAPTAGDAGRATDLEGGVREALAALPARLVPRIVLLSDGHENRGSIARAAYQARQLGVPIDTVAIEGRPPSALHLDSVSLPPSAFTGEPFRVELNVSSPRQAEATLTLVADGKTLGKTPVRLVAGDNRIRAHANLNTAGAVDFALALESPGLGELRFDQALTLRRPKLVYLSSDPVAADANLLQALAAAQLDVSRSQDLNGAQLVVLNNQDLEAFPMARRNELAAFVQSGGGMLVIGGENNRYAEGKTVEDALDRALPAKVAPPRSPEATCVVLIVDKSSSMEGRKIELARLAAIGVIDNLRPIDQVGVLIFDNSFQWAVPLRRAEDRSMIKRLVAGITPDGGTQIAPALAEAFRRINASNATFRHIVLLTDGISEEGDSIEVSRQAAERHVTISTVGLGQDVNRAYLEKVAVIAKGKAYLLNDPSGLERILLKDVMEHTGSTAVEKPLQPKVKRPSEILEGVGIESAPALAGYVRFTPKLTADTLLTIDDKGEPLFTRWQYGLGRVAVFTSDAKNRWASSWMSWRGYDKFWMNVVRDLLPRATPGEASAEFDAANRELVVNYRLEPGTPDPNAVPAIFAIGPGGFEHPVPVVKVAGGAYQGRIAVGSQQGLFRIRPVAESRLFPEVGYYRQEEELRDSGTNTELLAAIARYTGGAFNPEPRAVFDARGRSVPSSVRLWPGLLALAIALNLAELVVRKWHGIAARWSKQ